MAAPESAACYVCGQAAIVLLSGRSLCTWDYIQQLNELNELGLTPPLLAEQAASREEMGSGRERRVTTWVIPPSLGTPPPESVAPESSATIFAA